MRRRQRQVSRTPFLKTFKLKRCEEVLRCLYQMSPSAVRDNMVRESGAGKLISEPELKTPLPRNSPKWS
jgi:hypothetical protein